MRNVLVLAILISPLFLIAQEKGIVFEHGLSWQQVLDKAKAENKYVFVDCFTTWCGPCKQMERQVYVDDSVGQFMNGRFISVKVQMDTTLTDGKEVKDWYKTAHELQEQYSVHAYPSFLFFSPNGLLSSKNVGAREASVFMYTANMSLDSNKEKYALIYKKYKEGNLRFREMPDLAIASGKLGLGDVEAKVARDYMVNYLANLTTDTAWTKDNLIFIQKYCRVLHSSDSIFQRYFRDRKKIDSLLGPLSRSGKVVNFVVYDDLERIIRMALENHTEPKWNKVARFVRQKYGQEFTSNNVLKARVKYYQEAENWQQYTKFFIYKCKEAGIEKYNSGAIAALLLNNSAYEIFKYGHRKRDLKTALSWVDRAMKMDSGIQAHAIDTKANLLYKLGNKKESILLEEKSVNINPADQEVQENLNKMKGGFPTWIAG